ncbi:MAG: primosomal protein N' [Wenzhouxiangella sp.]|nr:MAG: primosomal protein N' [Wenzhouxiangella sp.]
MKVAQVAVPVPVPRLFDYRSADNQPLPPVGSRVLVPFGSRRLVGLVTGHAEAAQADGLKPIERVLDSALIDESLLALFAWCRRYYACAPGEAVNLLLPGALRRVKPFREPNPDYIDLTTKGRAADLARAPRQAEVVSLLQHGALKRADLKEAGIGADILRRMLSDGLVEAIDCPPALASEPGPNLNEEQRAAAAAILRSRNRFAALLLAGVTGSGKTEVYLHVARRLLFRGRQVLILVPEIGLTPQLVRRIEKRLGCPATVYHSGLSEGERLAAWKAARDGRARVIVGTRSAVFLPLARPGLIVVDEEHDGSFKQQDGARYHGRDVAVLRAARLAVPIVLGSATPSLESLNNVDAGRYQLLTLTQRAGGASMPRWQVLDTRGEGGALDQRLEATIERHLNEGGQVLLYRNRRGYAPVLICNACGWQADCHRCDAHMTWHQTPPRLQCHHCGAQQRTPPRCPECGSPSLEPLGAGTERLEDLLKKRFPDVPVHRVDRDAMTGRADFENLLDLVRDGAPCILVGTQMLAKGHHLPGVTLAAVLDVDQALFSADFRAPERLGQAVHQVAGRSGRAERPGQFLIQTRHPEHPLLAALLGDDYLGYAQCLLAERRAAGLPPAHALALVRAEAHQAQEPRDFLVAAARCLRMKGIDVAGPIPAIMARRGGYWRFQLWLQSADRAHLVQHIDHSLEKLYALPNARRVRWHIDMDPAEL